MAEISASLVKELRERTGAGMMDCKKALAEAGADLEQAADWLRKKGLAAAAKKAGRIAAEGLIGVATEGGKGVVIEVNTETDFVARNEQFQNFTAKAAKEAMAVGGDVEKLKARPFPGSSRNVGEELTHLVATIGENMSVRRAEVISVSPGIVASYIHNQVAPGLGKIGVLVALKSGGDAAKLAALGRQLAMHVAAANPRAVRTAELDPKLIDNERKILTEQASSTRKSSSWSRSTSSTPRRRWGR
jgi:elongation factor Ts